MLKALFRGSLILLPFLLAVTVPASSSEPFPPCSSVTLPAAVPKVGVVIPASPALATFLQQPELANQGIMPCQESQDAVWPRLAPWDSPLPDTQWHAWSILLFSLLLAAMLLPRHTPARYWHHATLLGTAVKLAAGWSLYIIVMNLAYALGGQRLFYNDIVHLHGPGEPVWLEIRTPDELTRHLHPAPNASQVDAGVTIQENHAIMVNAGDEYKVRQALALRQGAGINSTRLATLPKGDVVRLTGQRAGDWWQVSSRAIRQTGWVNSLWLRQPGEQQALPLQEKETGHARSAR